MAFADRLDESQGLEVPGQSDTLSEVRYLDGVMTPMCASVGASFLAYSWSLALR